VAEYYILKDRVPVPTDLMTWAKAFEDISARIVAKDEFAGVMVSTVFLGLNHRFGDGPPLLFETIIFGGPFDQEMNRYATYDEAETGHAAMVAKAKCGQ
jgi:hypothetical protein